MRLVFSLMLVATAAQAQDPAQIEAAVRIETLANSQPSDPPVVTTGIDFGIYLPDVDYGAALHLDACQLRLEFTTYSQVHPPFSAAIVDVDLERATVAVDDSGLPYVFDDLPAYFTGKGGPRGVIGFTAQAEAAFSMQRRRAGPDMDPMIVPPQDWPLISSDEPFTLYSMGHDVSEQRISDLASALIDYQQTYCKPSS